jgi:phosphopantothenoylcysteine decarboxylase/phosphopantothenate--cysteine ligase
MTAPLTGRRVLLIIAGGIAAYKTLDLIRLIRQAGGTVQVVMTQAATHIVTPLSAAALSGNPVATELFPPHANGTIDHIRLAREADLVVVAPATANRIAKLAHGLADDLASTLLLATRSPILLAPAMNAAMWTNAATQDNWQTLRRRGVHSVGPASGALACGEDGPGRMSEAAEIFDSLLSLLTAPRPLAGKRVLVTSGPTYEPIDPVRFIGNRSSGKTGYALAEALAAAGAETILVTGPTALPDPASVHVVHVETANDMHAACAAVTNLDVAICAAAVADWRPQDIAPEKIKKDATSPESAPVIRLTENPDILASLAQSGPTRPKLVIGFAAETEACQANARAKFARKGCDWMLANEVGNGKAFGADTNQVTLLRRDAQGAIRETAWEPMSKRALATALTQAIAAFFAPEQAS